MVKKNMDQSITYENIENYLARWSKYIIPEEFEILKEFIYNTANNIPSDKLLIFCGPGNTGKTTLVNELISLIGKSNYTSVSLSYNMNNNINNNKNAIIRNDFHYTKQLMIYNYDEMNNTHDTNIKNILERKPILSKKLYQPTECHYPKANQLLVTNNLRKINDELLELSNVIHFTHIF